MAVIIQQPNSLSMSGNMKKFIISSGSPVSFLLKEGDTVLLESSYVPGEDGRVTVDLKDIVENRLTFLLSHDGMYEQTGIVKTFTAEIDETTTVTFRVIRAGVADLQDTVSNWLRTNFLTWQHTNKRVTYYSPEWLTYYATQACDVKLKAYFPDDTVQNVNLGACEAGKAFTFNVQYARIAGLLGQTYPTHYDVWVESGGNRLTYVQRYLYSEKLSEQEQWFVFENSLGGVDTVRAYGETDFTGEHAHKVAETDNSLSEYHVDTKRSFNKNTGHLNQYERRWMLDFFPSRKKYIYFNSGLRSIVVTDSDVKYQASDLPSSYNFTYRFSDDTAALLNLIRNEDEIPAAITIPDISSPDFHLPPRLVEYPRVQLHEGVILPTFDPHSDTAKVTTFGALSEMILSMIEFPSYSASDIIGLQELLDQIHTHSNKEVLDALTTADIAVLSKLAIVDGKLKISVPAYSTGELSAYGLGSGSPGGSITIIDNLTSTATDAALSANMGRYLKSLIDNVSGGSGSDVYWDDILNKPLTFTPSSHNHNWIHITDRPSSLPASDVYSWAKASSKPSYTWSEIGSKPTTLGGYGITDAASLSAFNSHANDTTRHITSTERSNWNSAYSDKHTHSNKSIIDSLTQDHLNVLAKFSLVDGKMKVSTDFYSTGELSAYGLGSGSPGGSITIIDNLTSTATDAALSANQGRVLKGLVDGKADKSTTYTKAEVNTALTGKADLVDGKVPTSQLPAISSLELGETTGTAYEGSKGKAVTDNLASHTANKSNPHQVTKAQVGLGNVDDTSDANKPVSSATQTELNKKEDKANKKTAWSATPSDTNYPSEKLVKSSLDGKVPTTRKINGKALSADINLSASDVGAAASGHDHDTRYLGINATAAAATKLATARSIWGQSFDGTANVTGALSNVTNIDATGYVKVPKLDLGNGWTIEASTNEIHVKLSGTVKARFLSGGFVSTGEVTAFS